MGVPKPVLDDLLEPRLRVVFCGTAAGRISAERQCYYAHPQNKFWRVLHAVGLTPRLLMPNEYRELLEFRIGLTDIAKFDFGPDSRLPRSSLNTLATQALRKRIEASQPGVLAFTSLNGGKIFLKRAVSAGEQTETIGQSRIWVLPSPSPTANWCWSAEPWRRLAEAVREAA